MLMLPWLTVTFVPKDAAMAACLFLFFAVDSIFFVTLGGIAGRNRKRFWNLPVISAVLFLFGAWFFLGMGSFAFLMYAGIYLVLGVISMMVFDFFVRKFYLNNK